MYAAGRGARTCNLPILSAKLSVAIILVLVQKILIQNSFELTRSKIERDIRDFVVTGNFGALW
jgi:hypothetical protein